jgi:hypothetical protein
LAGLSASIRRSNGAGLQASVPAYAGGIALWAAGLMLISAPTTFALWMRLAALAAALLVVSACMTLWGALAVGHGRHCPPPVVRS